VLNGTVFLARSQQSTTAPQDESILDQLPLPLPVLVGIPIAAAVAIVFVIKKKRSKKKLAMLTQGDTDIVSIFDGAKKKENES
ncbi:hypothetical protein, partial [Candidatus Nitrosotalea sp. FS]|uniref:hypothetical protein n=1 Tax=Candidatus Nitrosotalea sp. FS TaxID=2341021 RepID=UPI001409A9B5